MTNPTNKKILSIVKNIEQEQNKENRNDRLRTLEAENQLLRGNLERTDERLKALENYLGVEYVREAKYRKV